MLVQDKSLLQMSEVDFELLLLYHQMGTLVETLPLALRWQGEWKLKECCDDFFNIFFKNANSFLTMNLQVVAWMKVQQKFQLWKQFCKVTKKFFIALFAAQGLPIPAFKQQ